MLGVEIIHGMVLRDFGVCATQTDVMAIHFRRLLMSTIPGKERNSECLLLFVVKCVQISHLIM